MRTSFEFYEVIKIAVEPDDFCIRYQQHNIEIDYNIDLKFRLERQCCFEKNKCLFGMMIIKKSKPLQKEIDLLKKKKRAVVTLLKYKPVCDELKMISRIKNNLKKSG